MGYVRDAIKWRTTYTKALKAHKGNGLCQRCNKVEDDIHIFFQCEDLVPALDRFKKLIESEGRATWTAKSLLIGESVGCSNGLWTVLRVEILWWLWLARLEAIYGGIKEDFGKLKEKIIKAREEYFSVTLVEIEERIKQLANKGQNVVDALELETRSRKK